MAQIAEILKEEKERGSQEARRRIHFFEEGSFFRAYEWSAWLMCLHYMSANKKATSKSFLTLMTNDLNDHLFTDPLPTSPLKGEE